VSLPTLHWLGAEHNFAGHQDMVALLLLFGLIILLVLGALLSRLAWTERKSFIGWHGRRRKRGRAVLLSCLSPQQRAEFLTNGSFEAIAGSGNRYLISARRMGNIQHLDDRGRRFPGVSCSFLHPDHISHCGVSS
jgi:hypothetical protein